MQHSCHCPSVSRGRCPFTPRAETEIFYGLATPPTSYGGYGGVSANRKDDGEKPWRAPMLRTRRGGRVEALPRLGRKMCPVVDCRSASPSSPGPFAAKYIFEHPAGWKSETINKRDKGTQGVDCRVSSARGGC